MHGVINTMLRHLHRGIFHCPRGEGSDFVPGRVQHLHRLVAVYVGLARSVLIRTAPDCGENPVILAKPGDVDIDEINHRRINRRGLQPMDHAGKVHPGGRFGKEEFPGGD